MTIEEKAQAYDEALERAKDVYTYYSDDTEQLRKIESIVPELKESGDERIRKELIAHCENLSEMFHIIDKKEDFVKYQSWINWLEKQDNKDNQVKLPTFTFDDILALQCCMETVKKVQEDKELYEKLNDLHSRVYDAYRLEKQGEQNPF